MYGSIERLFHASSNIVSLICKVNYMYGSIEAPLPILLVWYDKVNYMYGSIERLFHASSNIVSLMWQS